MAIKKIIIYSIIFVLLFAATLSAKNYQWINAFLIRHNYLSQGSQGIQQANEYRINNYTMIVHSRFMGKHVMLNKQVIPSMKCVEKRIKENCSDNYKPANISSWRTRNTIQGEEISDHLFGIALDIDPAINVCCQCVKEWAKSKRCFGDGVVINDDGTKTGKYDLPKCWIDSFKAEGWFWYGDDTTLRDTMHFSFIGKPNQGCQ